jgi:hypothetical protein
MPALRLAHHNNCPRCPVFGAEDIPGNEYFELRALRFNLRVARGLCRKSMLHRVDRRGLENWLEHVLIDPPHIDHLPRNLGPGIMVTLPGGVGRPLIDGNHRAARALRDGTEFAVYLLPEPETLELLRRSMGHTTADHLWNRLYLAKPHPNDVQEGEER